MTKALFAMHCTQAHTNKNYNEGKIHVAIPDQVRSTEEMSFLTKIEHVNTHFSSLDSKGMALQHVSV